MEDKIINDFKIRIIYNPFLGYACADNHIQFFWRNSAVFYPASFADKLHTGKEIRVGCKSMINVLRELQKSGSLPVEGSTLEFLEEDIYGIQREYKFE